VYPPYRSQVDRSILEVDSPEPLTRIGEQIVPQTPPEPTGLVLVDGSPAVLADALCIEFHADDFEGRRSEAGDEPLVDVAFDMANNLLGRLRTLGRAGHVKPINPTSTPWRLVYANDDRSALEPQEGLRRGLGSVTWRWQLFGLREDLWLVAGQLPDDFQPTAWDTLLLDALDLLPDVGPTIVLLLAAIETRLETALDLLASRRGVDDKLWAWLNGRAPGPRRGPQLFEQAESLLEIVSGHSLAEDERLWNGFQDIRKARNSFVHEGHAAIDRVPVTSARASSLIPLAAEIIDWIEGLLPPENRRPRDEREGEHFVEVTKWVMRSGPDEPSSPS
jgi:hypothetical protein